MTRPSPLTAMLFALALATVVTPATPVAADDEYYERDDYDDGYDQSASLDDAPEYVDTAPEPSRYGEALAPYGRWLDHPTYGRVWQPGVPADWRPFTEGHWVWTSEGWTWVSSEPWGWTFHYGRWVQDPGAGWLWIPSDDWSPAWVDWYEEDGYVGWAPLGMAAAPAVGFGAFVFVPFDHFFSRRVHRFFVPHQRLPFRRLGNHGHWRAPDRREIEAHSRERAPTVRLRHDGHGRDRERHGGDERRGRDVPVGPRGNVHAPRTDFHAPHRDIHGPARGDTAPRGNTDRPVGGPRGGVRGPGAGMVGPRGGVGGPAGGGAPGGGGGGGHGGGHR